MANNKFFFLEQQKEAFYEHHFDKLLLSELEQTLAPFKGNKPPEFPHPKHIYEKKFSFLPVPLGISQQNRLALKPHSKSEEIQENKICSHIEKGTASKNIYYYIN
jgi:hypothetical protein